VWTDVDSAAFEGYVRGTNAAHRARRRPVMTTPSECREKLADLEQRLDALGRYL
jgi:hypothetical protein